MIQPLKKAVIQIYGSFYAFDMAQGLNPRNQGAKKFLDGLQKTIDTKNKKLNLIGYELVLKRKAGNND